MRITFITTGVYKATKRGLYAGIGVLLKLLAPIIISADDGEVDGGVGASENVRLVGNHNYMFATSVLTIDCQVQTGCDPARTTVTP